MDLHSFVIGVTTAVGCVLLGMTVCHRMLRGKPPVLPGRNITVTGGEDKTKPAKQDKL